MPLHGPSPGALVGGSLREHVQSSGRASRGSQSSRLTQPGLEAAHRVGLGRPPAAALRLAVVALEELLHVRGQPVPGIRRCRLPRGPEQEAAAAGQASRHRGRARIGGRAPPLPFLFHPPA